MPRLCRFPAAVLLMFLPPLALPCVASAQQGNAKGKFAPPPGKTLVAIGAGWDEVAFYTKATRHHPLGVKFYNSLRDEGNVRFFWQNVRKSVPPGGFLVMETDLNGITDEGIRLVGEAIREFKGPVFADLEGEFETDFRDRPQEYVALYRKVHDAWDRLGVKNVAYVWHSIGDLAHGQRRRPNMTMGELLDFYPGDRYVDWFGISMFFGPQVQAASQLVQMARQRGKPVALIEFGHRSPNAWNWDGTWEGWYAPAFRLIESWDIKLVGYSNYGDAYAKSPRATPGDPFVDTRMDRMSPDIQENWGLMMRSPRFRGASPSGGDNPEDGKKSMNRDLAMPKESDTTATGRAVNLLGRIDPKRDAVEGDWRLIGKVLTFDGDKEWSRIQVPYQPPEEYDLTVVAERVRGTEILIIGLVVGGHQATVVLDGWGGGVSGLERIDGKVSQDNETTHRGWRFSNGRPTTINCRVRRGGVSVTCDGKPIIDWKGDASRLSIVGGWKVPDDGQLFLGGWKGGAFRFRKLEVKEVSKSGLPDVGAASTAATPTAGGKFCPPKGKRLLIIGQDRDSMTAYVRDTGQVPGGFMSYNHLNAFGGQMGIKPHYIDGLHDFNIVREHPNTVLQVGLVFKGMEKEIAQGVHDDRIDRLADWFREANVPVYLRVGPEFDLPADNGFGWPTYEPEPYKLAFRHVVDRFRLKGAGKNVAFVWHSAAWKGVEKVWASYPGDDYVDWFAVSLFGRENNDGAALFARYARQRGKPLMIAEATPLGGLVGTKDGVHTWESWFRPFFDYIEKNDVRVVCFLPVDWESIETYRGKGWRDTRVQTVPEIRKRWLAEVGQAKYLKASEGLFETLGYRRQTRVSSSRPRPPLWVDGDLDLDTVDGPQAPHVPVSVVPVVDVRVAIREA